MLNRLLPAYCLFVQNYLSLPLGSLAWLWLTVAWSLGVEEQFYLISPPLVRFLSTKKLKTVLTATLILTPLFRAALVSFWSGGAAAMYVWMPCRFDSLAMGVLAALLWREGKIRIWYATSRSRFFLLLAALAAAIPFFIEWLFSP